VDDNERAVLVNKVKKILAKTEESGCTAEEAAAAMAKAQALMVEHNLNMAQVSDAEAASAGVMTDTEIDECGRWTNDHDLSACICNRYFFVQSWKATKTVDGKKRVFLYFFGTRENIETARWVYGSITSACSRLWKEYRVRNPFVPRTERRTFILGLFHGICDKLTEERQADEIERDIMSGGAVGGTALALADVQTKVALAYREAHPTFKKARKLSFGNGSESSLKAGYDEGRNLSLNRPIEASKPAKMKRLGN
jgi:hypothetical protein